MRNEICKNLRELLICAVLVLTLAIMVTVGVVERENRAVSESIGDDFSVLRDASIEACFEQRPECEAIMHEISKGDGK